MRSAYLASDEETENGAKNRLVIFAEQLINELSDQTSRVLYIQVSHLSTPANICDRETFQ